MSIINTFPSGGPDIVPTTVNTTIIANDSSISLTVYYVTLASDNSLLLASVEIGADSSRSLTVVKDTYLLIHTHSRSASYPGSISTLYTWNTIEGDTNSFLLHINKNGSINIWPL